MDIEIGQRWRQETRTVEEGREHFGSKGSNCLGLVSIAVMNSRAKTILGKMGLF